MSEVRGTAAVAQTGPLTMPEASSIDSYLGDSYQTSIRYQPTRLSDIDEEETSTCQSDTIEDMGFGLEDDGC